MGRARSKIHVQPPLPYPQSTESCGPPCRAGQVVSKECDASVKQKTECKNCTGPTFSLGGLATSCSTCRSCVGWRRGGEHTACNSHANFPCSSSLLHSCQPHGEDAYSVVPCTPSSDTACLACSRCIPMQFESAPCTATSNRACQVICVPSTAVVTFGFQPLDPHHRLFRTATQRVPRTSIRLSGARTHRIASARNAKPAPISKLKLYSAPRPPIA